MSPGETEAGSAGKQPCRGIARWKLIQTMRRVGGSDPPARFLPSSEDRFPHALKIHAPRGNYSLTQTGFTPIPAEPRHRGSLKPQPSREITVALNLSRGNRGVGLEAGGCWNLLLF